MNLLGWASAFGPEPSLDALLADPRAIADNAMSGGWVPHDRATLGVLCYRGAELLRNDLKGLAGPRAASEPSLRGPSASEQARMLLQTATGGYRATKMLDVVPVVLGLWAEAERRCGAPERAVAMATEAAVLLEKGAPSLLNEAPVYLALHDACVDLERFAEAKDAIRRGLPWLVTRVRGLRETPYARDFLRHLAPNAGLITAAEAYGLLPESVRALLAS
jgi:hypothetical protein